MACQSQSSQAARPSCTLDLTSARQLISAFCALFCLFVLALPSPVCHTVTWGWTRVRDGHAAWRPPRCGLGVALPGERGGGVQRELCQLRQLL